MKIKWWTVVYADNGEIVDTFSSRQEAREYRKKCREKTKLYKVINFNKRYEYILAS